ncbi:calcium-binding protein [Pseudanabaena cinerea]|uniref:calcium-binding protein n=1 Tax=Pseudanabaena cinerea TaxID=2661616 RepID=UPI001F552A00|nr:hypothetical protein [Pseudanabaena cinerea]
MDGGLAPLGYDPLGLNNNLAQANGLIKAKLLQGDYVATQTYGWTEFDIDPTTQNLTVTTYGIKPYTRAELEANPSLITSRTPAIVSQFEVEANQVIAEAKLSNVGSTNNDDLIAATGQAFDGRSNIVFTGAGNDKLDLQFSPPFAVGNNRIDAGSDNDIIYVSQNDVVFGGSGNDEFFAQEGKGGNRMSGGAGNDFFYLGAGDRALGGDGNDQFFVSSGGNNLLSGGAGSDIFNIITAGTIPSAANTIIDFQIGTDKIGISGISASALSLSQVGANAVIATVVGGQAIATLTGIQASSLSFANTAQFTFA